MYDVKYPQTHTETRDCDAQTVCYQDNKTTQKTTKSGAVHCDCVLHHPHPDTFVNSVNV